MAKNQVFKFVDVLSLPVPEGVKSGEPVILDADTGWVGVAETDRSEDDGSAISDWDSYTYAGGNYEGYASVALKGAYTLDVTGAVTPTTPVYITESRTLTATAGTNVRFGYALTTKGSGTGPVTVLIDGAPAAA